MRHKSIALLVLKRTGAVSSSTNRSSLARLEGHRYFRIPRHIRTCCGWSLAHGNAPQNQNRWQINIRVCQMARFALSRLLFMKIWPKPRTNPGRIWPALLFLIQLAAGAGEIATTDPAQAAWLSPSALAASADGRTLFIACSTANSVAVFDRESRKTEDFIRLPGSPSGLCLTADGGQLVVTCAAPVSQVCIVDLKTRRVVASIPTGHTALGPVLASDQRTLYVCNQFDDCVAIIDLQARREIGRIKTAREPVAAALTPDGRNLLVANHLPTGRADGQVVAASVSVIDLQHTNLVKELALPNGSGLLRDVRTSPDGNYACVTHNLARFHLPTTQLDRGWMNTSALTLLNLKEMKVINTVLLDNVDRGAANPWAAAWSADGKQLCVSHAGTHELSVIDASALLEKLARMPANAIDATAVDYASASRIAAEVPNDLAFLVGLRQRVQLAGNGPRALLLIGRQAWVADYFSDTLEVVDLKKEPVSPELIPLHPAREMSIVRRGEMLFNDAKICFQGWQSCATCHSQDARVDGLNWDLLNDGIGNPKNTKSMLLSHRTPPAMSMGVRETAESAVRAGIRHILFTVQPEDVPLAIDEYLKSLKPIPSPTLVHGQPSAAARRGAKLFANAKTGCATCHPLGLFTDLQHHDVGTRGKFDQPTDTFDTPTLVEIWRTAPYLHDGSAATVRDVLTVANPNDRHGRTSHLTGKQIDDLVAYLLSL
jgi:DNA-binding beta-propeller fold protein YncE/mono/diheme cytochrome c family protein